MTQKKKSPESSGPPEPSGPAKAAKPTKAAKSRKTAKPTKSAKQTKAEQSAKVLRSQYDLAFQQLAPSLAETIRITCDQLPDGLIDDAGRDRLINRIKPLPPHAAWSIFALEIRCGDLEAAADICFSVPKGGALAKYFVEQGDKDGGPIGKATAASFRAFLGRKTKVERAIDAIMLEYDVLTENAAGQWPALFMGPVRRKHEAAARTSCYRDAEQAALAFGTAGMPVTGANMTALRRVFEVMGQDMTMSHAGIFPGREPAIGRLNIYCDEVADIAGRLARMGWTGDSGPITDIMADFADLTPNYRLALDLYDGQLLPRLGVEAAQEKINYHGDPYRWNRFVTRLEERGLCLPVKAEGLRRWAGQELVFDETGTYIVIRAFNHFKFDMKDNKTVTARAYGTSILMPKLPSEGEKTPKAGAKSHAGKAPKK